MTFHILKSDFSRGALHPLAHARQEKEFYSACLESSTNFQILKYGGIRRRSGTRYCGTTKLSGSSAARFIEFRFNSDQSYFLEFGDLYFRVRTADGALVLSGGSPVEVVTPYTAAQVADIQYIQSGDTIFLAHPSHAPRQIVRVSNTSWTLSTISFLDGPYLSLNDTATTVTFSSTATAGTSRTATFSSTTGVNGGAGVTADDIGRQIRFQVGGKYGWGTITAVASTTVCTVSVTESEITTNAATATWRLGLQSIGQGYFSSVSFYQGRLCWANTTAQPRAVALSQAGLPYRYTPSSLTDASVNDDHGFTVFVLSGLADEILWLKESSTLQMGTASAIRSIGPQDNSGAFGPRNFRERLEVGSGCSVVQPVLAGPSTIHVSKFGTTLRDLFYDYQVASLVAPELSTLSQHLLTTGITKLAYAQEPTSIVWAQLGSGELVGVTYERYDKVIGLHHHALSGGVIEDISVVSNNTDKYDALIMIVRRTINGSTVRYVEILEPPFENMDLEDAWFVDCGLQYSGSAVSTVTGLSHLQGETVSVLADGAVIPNRVVNSSGEIELPTGITASKVTVGLPMTSSAKFLRIALQARDGWQLGLEKRSPYAIVDVYETSGLKVRANGKDEIVHLRKPSDPMGTSPGLNTGTKRVIVEGGWKDEAQFELVCDSVLPATIRAVNFGVSE